MKEKVCQKFSPIKTEKNLKEFLKMFDKLLKYFVDIFF